jgi:hypothetical protein
MLSLDALRRAYQKAQSQAEALAVEQGIGGGDDNLLLRLFGVSWNSFIRGGVRSRSILRIDPNAADDIDASAAFSLAHALGEQAALDIAVGLLSSPAVRGREIEAMQRLRAGERIDEILAFPARLPEPEPVAAPGTPVPTSNVVSLAPRRRAMQP